MNTPRLIQPSDRFFLLNFPAINDGLVFSECVKIVNALRVRPDAADAVDFSEEIQAIEKLQAKIETHDADPFESFNAAEAVKDVYPEYFTGKE